MHCSKTWINVHRFLDFANTRILAKTCPALSWDQALLSLSWVNRNRKVLPFNAVLVYWITCACESNVIIYCCITCMCIHVITVTSRTLNSTPGPLRPHTVHIGRENMGISRMRTDRGKSRYTVIKCRWPSLSLLGCELLLSPAIKMLKVIYVDDGQYSL